MSHGVHAVQHEVEHKIEHDEGHHGGGHESGGTTLSQNKKIALLIAVFPANLHMAQNPELYPGISPVLLWLRLPLQGVLIAWAYGYTR